MKQLFACISIVLISLCTSCGSSIENYGEIPSQNAPKSTIVSILISPQDYVGKEVVIEGVISAECPTGGWIDVVDEGGHRINVEFHAASFAPLPQRVGRFVIAKGVVFQTSGSIKEVKLLAEGLIIK